MAGAIGAPLRDNVAQKMLNEIMEEDAKQARIKLALATEIPEYVGASGDPVNDFTHVNAEQEKAREESFERSKRKTALSCGFAHNWK